MMFGQPGPCAPCDLLSGTATQAVLGHASTVSGLQWGCLGGRGGELLLSTSPRRLALHRWSAFQHLATPQVLRTSNSPAPAILCAALDKADMHGTESFYASQYGEAESEYVVYGDHSGRLSVACIAPEGDVEM
ncbi:hypothetical protein KIPB_005503 [Kipferlia bialata]|uniref:Uncharacterized protein n=1 Tax=Kipferlia bialata TaxID=797122 RepID=A0A391NRH6_9EUKA|nr:hypothetical protein KIPB_005503 [Kipferlia bialata]|eukprot:g5503.t1